MKKTVYLLVLIIISTLSLSAQKKVRMNVRSGNTDYRSKLYNSASAKYMNALKENPASNEASFNLGNTYYRLGKWDDAVKQYEHNISTQNKDQQKRSDAFANLGNTFLKKASKKNEASAPDKKNDDKQQDKQPDPLAQSIEAYKQALRLNPNDDKVRYNLAVAQKIQQDRQNDKNNKNKNKDKDKNKNKNDKNKDKNKNKQDNKDKNNNQNKDQNKNDQNKNKNNQNKNSQNQMSQENMQQILNELQQDEKATQQKVQQIKAQQQKRKNNQNRKNDMDW